MPYIEDLLEILQSLGLNDDWQPAETIESGGGTIPKTSSKGLVRASDNSIIELGPFARIMAQYAMRDRAVARAAGTLGSLALNLAKGAYDRAEQLRTRMLRTGRVYLANKCVVSGLNVTAGSGRSLSIAEGTAFHGGYRRYYAARPNAIAVPTNPGTSPVDYVLYLDNNGNPYLVEGTEAPEGGLALARVTVPAGDTGTTFAGTITDLRLIYNPTTWAPLNVSKPIPLDPAMPDTNYQVYLHIESATDLEGAGAVVVSKAKNAFTLALRGVADDVVVRWLAVHLSRWV